MIASEYIGIVGRIRGSELDDFVVHLLKLVCITCKFVIEQPLFSKHHFSGILGFEDKIFYRFPFQEHCPVETVGLDSLLVPFC